MFSRVNSKPTNQCSSFCLSFDWNWWFFFLKSRNSILIEKTKKLQMSTAWMIWFVVFRFRAKTNKFLLALSVLTEAVIQEQLIDMLETSIWGKCSCLTKDKLVEHQRLLTTCSVLQRWSSNLTNYTQIMLQITSIGDRGQKVEHWCF